MTGTNGEKAASDQIRPLVRNRRYWTYHPPNATRRANRTRPARESGVVFGSEIMKKAKRRKAPLSRRCTGMASGSPSQKDRPATRLT